MPFSVGAFLLSKLSTAFLISVVVKFLLSVVFTIFYDCSLVCLCCLLSSVMKCSNMSFSVSSKLFVCVPSGFCSVVSCVRRFI
jgi:hypothetical protein